MWSLCSHDQGHVRGNCTLRDFQLFLKFTERCLRKAHVADATGCLPLAHRVISLLRSSSAALGAKRTSGIVGRVVAKVQRQHLATAHGHIVGSKYGH
jgi:hypothetical protein